MTLVRRIARPLLASMFVVGGVDAVRHPEGKAKVAGDLVTKIVGALPLDLPSDPVDLVRIDGAVKVGAGLALATGRFPRASALVLAASLVPTTYAGHGFWTVDDPTQRAQQRIHFFKNASMLGGLILAAVDTEGKPSVAWRTRHAASATKKETRRAAKRAQRAQQRTQHRAAKRLPTR